MQNGCDLAIAAGYLGMTLKTIEEVYAHHHPDHQEDAVQAIAARPKQRETLVISLEKERAAGAETVKSLKYMVGQAGLEPATRPL